MGMELALLGGLMYLGNKINFKQEDSSKLVEKSKDPIKNNIINNSVNSVNNISLNYKDMNSKFYESNKKMLKDSEKLESFNNNLSYENQFRPLTFDNDSNPLPSSFNKSNNSIEKDLAIGNGYSYLNDNMNYGVTDENDLDHNNMVPHFSKKQIINDYNEQTFAHRMELFSGSSKNFTPKKELLKENLDPSQTSRPDGGSFEEYRPMPKTVDELRSYDNPKITFEGVMKSGQKGSKSSTIGKVYKRVPEKTRELKVDDLQKMGGEYKKEKSRDNIILKDTGRTTSQMVIGSAKYQNDSVSKKNNSEVKESKKKENTIIDFSNFKSIIDKVKSNLDSYMLTKNQRYDTSTLNLNPPNKYSLGVVKFDPHDLAKKTIKETTSINQQSGHARNDIDSVKTYDPNDILKTTKKQTTSFNEQTGYAKSEINNTQFYDPNDIPNRTQREYLLFNQQSLNAKSEINNTQFYNPNDIPNRTHREDTIFNQNLLNNRADVNRSLVYNPNDLPNRTQKDDLVFTKDILNSRGDVNRTSVYDPNNLPNRTQKEDLVFTKRSGNVGGDLKNKSFDPNNIPAKTLKELIVNEYEYGIAHGLINKGVSFNPYDIPAETLKEMIVYNDFIQGANPSNEGGGYLTSKVQIPETLRQLVSILRFSGALGHQAPKDYTAEKNMII